jgi:hypothetical protein
MDVSTRFATLKLNTDALAPALTARVPGKLSAEEFGHLTRNAYEVISKLTNHPCMSGRIKFVVEDNLMSEITRVDLNTGKGF